MELELISHTKIQQLISIFQYLEGFSANVNLMFYSDRLYMQTMDSARVSVCELFLPDSWFHKYTLKQELKSGKYIQVGMNVSLLARVLKIINNKSLNLGNGNGIKLQLTYEINSDVFSVSIFFNLPAFFDKKGKKMEEIVSLKTDTETLEKTETLETAETPEKKQDYHFELPLIFLSEERMRIPITMDYSADFALASDWFAEIIKNLRIFGDDIELECSESSISLSSRSEDQGMMRVPLSTDDLHFFSIEEDLVLRMKFRTSFLFVISQFHRLSKWVYLHLMKEQPMQIIYDLMPKNEKSDLVEDENSIPDARLVFYLVESLL